MTNRRMQTAWRKRVKVHLRKRSIMLRSIYRKNRDSTTFIRSCWVDKAVGSRPLVAHSDFPKHLQMARDQDGNIVRSSNRASQAIVRAPRAATAKVSTSRGSASDAGRARSTPRTDGGGSGAPFPGCAITFCNFPR